MMPAEAAAAWLSGFKVKACRMLAPETVYLCQASGEIVCTDMEWFRREWRTLSAATGDLEDPRRRWVRLWTPAQVRQRQAVEEGRLQTRPIMSSRIGNLVE